MCSTGSNRVINMHFVKEGHGKTCDKSTNHSDNYGLPGPEKETTT